MSRDISAIMRRVRSSNTGPELRLRKALWVAGARSRLSGGDLPDKPDIVFRTHKVAIERDSDYWHGGLC